MTLEQTILRKIQEAFEAWDRAGRPGLFRVFLEEAEEGILDILAELPGVRTKLGQDRDGRKLLAELDKMPAHRPVPDSVLGLYIHDITMVYQQGHTAESFEAFLDRLRRECSTEEELDALLKRLNE
ncbi:hypothetical protein HY630_03805 [Candidatus Uhrbacteria bacterium]|nr:hypothetical protein [Candidatus Uhrbacteria bacterium]